MLFTLILLQARHLSLGVLGAVGFTPLDCLLYTLLMLRGESRVKADPADPIQPVASPVTHPVTPELQLSALGCHSVECAMLAGSAPSWRIKVKSIDPGDVPWLGPAFWA